MTDFNVQTQLKKLNTCPWSFIVDLKACDLQVSIIRGLFDFPLGLSTLTCIINEAWMHYEYWTIFCTPLHLSWRNECVLWEDGLLICIFPFIGARTGVGWKRRKEEEEPSLAALLPSPFLHARAALFAWSWSKACWPQRSNLRSFEGASHWLHYYSCTPTTTISTNASSTVPRNIADIINYRVFGIGSWDFHFGICSIQRLKWSGLRLVLKPAY